MDEVNYHNFVESILRSVPEAVAVNITSSNLRTLRDLSVLDDG